jgi:hypothetical protein
MAARIRFAPAYASVARPFERAHQHKVHQPEKMKILLIEDSKFQRIANERVLVKAGYSVIHAGDGEEGLRVAREDIPDLILLDMMLPISNRSDANFFRVQGAVFSSIDEPSLPPTTGKDRVPQVLVKRRRMFAGLEDAGALSDHFLAGITA